MIAFFCVKYTTLLGRLFHVIDIRDEFPVLSKGVIYLDSATVNLVPKSSIEQISLFYSNIGNTIRRGIHKLAQQAEDLFIEAKTKAANFVNASENEIAWMPSEDYGINFLLNSIDLKKGDKIITSVFEHHSLLAPLVIMEKTSGINIDYISLEGEYDLVSSILSKITSEVKLIALSHVSPLIGTYRDIERITENIKKEYPEIDILVDFSRSAGLTLIDLNRLKIDYAVFDGSLSMLAPNGSAFIYVRKEKIPKMNCKIAGSTSVRYLLPHDYGLMRAIERFEPGQPNIASFLALRKSIELLERISVEKIEIHRKEIMRNLFDRLQEIPKINIVDPLLDSAMGLPNRSNIVSLSIEGISPHDVAMMLDEMGNIIVRSGLICNHPGIYALGLEGVLQVSTHIYNNNEDIEVFTETLKQVMSVL